MANHPPLHPHRLNPVTGTVLPYPNYGVASTIPIDLVLAKDSLLGEDSKGQGFMAEFICAFPTCPTCVGFFNHQYCDQKTNCTSFAQVPETRTAIPKWATGCKLLIPSSTPQPARFLTGDCGCFSSAAQTVLRIESRWDEFDDGI